MGIFFTLLYIITAYVTPELLFGNALAQYHIQVYIAICAMVFSAFAASETGLSDMPQTYGLFGICAAVVCSIAFTGWLGGALEAILNFVPNALVYFFVITNFKKRTHLSLLVAVLFLVAVFDIGNAINALHNKNIGGTFVLAQNLSFGGSLLRIRGAAFLNDPNDLAQYLIGLIPFMFIFWRKDKFILNFFLVILPCSFMLYGMYLTHSRGAMVALFVAAIVLGRRKIGTVPAVILSVVLFAGLTAVGWSGGRSTDQGEGRLDAWSEGLTLTRTHPIFGVGYKLFSDHYEITAHNSVVCCAAELGLFGLITWLMIVVPTVRDASVGSRVQKAKKSARDEILAEREAMRAGPEIETATGKPALAFARTAFAGAAVGSHSGAPLVNRSAPRTGTGFGRALPGVFGERAEEAELSGAPATTRFSDHRWLEKLEESENKRLAALSLLSMTAFLTAAWFLSRSYTMTLFIYAGISGSIYSIGVKRGTAPEPWPFWKALRIATASAFGLLLFVYIFLRINHLVGMV